MADLEKIGLDGSDFTIPAGGATAGVETFNGRTGTVTPKNGDYTAEMVGLGNVDNTSDANKPVSTATQTALDAKANAADLATVATTGSYNDLTDQPVIPAAYTLPVATDSALGGVKVGANLTVAADGTLSATGGGGLPATSQTDNLKFLRYVNIPSSGVTDTVKWASIQAGAGIELQNEDGTQEKGNGFYIRARPQGISGVVETPSAPSGMQSGVYVRTTGVTFSQSGVSQIKSNAIAAPLTGLDTSLTDNITASDTVLGAMGKLAAALAALQNRLTDIPWASTANNEYGNIYWRITNGILFLVSGGVLQQIPAKQPVLLCTLPDNARGTGAVYAPVCATGGITGGATFDATRGTVEVWMNDALPVGARIFINIACPAS